VSAPVLVCRCALTNPFLAKAFTFQLQDFHMAIYKDSYGRTVNEFGAPVDNFGRPLSMQQAPQPGTVQPIPHATTPNRLQDFADSGSPFVRVPLYLPTGLFPAGDNIALVPRDRPLNYTFTAAGVTTPLTIQFDVATTVFAMSAGAYSTTGANLPVGASPLDMFNVLVQRTSTGDKLMTDAALASVCCGTGTQPRMIGPSGWFVDAGGSITVSVTSNAAHMAVTVMLWTCEVRGPSNFSWTHSKFAKIG